ncbi:LCP family protein [Thermophilibacter sp. ET337]|uniref:LCP family protein n=1 Tax=Thermophilibacter sp. ET337 TaxID=2973084 RepID=UPI0021AD1FF4|nr:LCP family protein [Thermophilibacter sp. ET337]MCR8908418.1 LCP family protein [Thermophilibacter sp. ET337]
MTSAEQAHLSQSRYGSASRAEHQRVAAEPRTTRRASSASSGGSRMQAPSRSEGVEAYHRKSRKKGRGRALRGVLVSLLVVLLGAGVAVALYLRDIDSRLNPDGAVSNSIREQLEAVEPQEPFYMLLLGVDKSEGRSEDWGSDTSNFRADTIILTRVDPPAQKVTLVSIPRDTLVDMGENGERKINDAYALGGAAYMTEIVSEFADVKISHYAEVDFEQLTSIVDTIGGIEVTLPVAVQDDYAQIDLPAGTQTLNGEQALGLCRARHAYDDYGGGDFYRAANQRMVIGAIVKKVLQLDLITMATTVSELANSVTTDFGALDIIGLVGQFRALDTDNNMYSGQTPTNSEYINSVWYEIPDDAAWEEMMARVDAGESPYSDASQDFTAGIAGSIGTGSNISDSEDGSATGDVEASFTGSVSVLNATGVAGLAGDTANTLTDAGFEAAAGNANESGLTATKIYYNDDSLASALGVAKTLGVPEANVSQNDGSYTTTYDVIVVLGTDQA